MELNIGCINFQTFENFSGAIAIELDYISPIYYILGYFWVQ